MMLTKTIRATRLFNYGILALLLTGCSEKPQGNPYFPLQKGLSWTYKVTTKYPDQILQDSITITNIGRQSFGKNSYFVRRTNTGIDYYLNHDEQGVYREGLRTVVETKPRLDREKRFVLKTPLEIGTEWREISRPVLLLRVYPYRERAGKSAQVPMTYRIESITATVTVPAGTFDNCIKVTANGSFNSHIDAVNGETEIPLTTEEWYAPGVGLVKQIRSELQGESITVFNTPIFLGGRTTLELESRL